MATKALMDKLGKEKTRLKMIVGELVARSEPVNIMHMMQFSIMMLRVEFTTMMAIMAEKKFPEENEYFKRVVDQIMFEVKTLERLLEVTVDENGRVHKLQRPKLIKPGPAQYLN